MALPHLPRCARTDLQTSSEEHRRLEANAAMHDRLVSPESFARSLEAFIALRAAARKAEGLVQRRARLCSLLREERLQQIEALQLLQPPAPENLWANLRPPGFFERLYRDERAANAGTVPPHLRSAYQAELWGQPLEEPQEDASALRTALLEQTRIRRTREAEEVDREREEGRQLLLRMEEAQQEEERREEEERRRRRAEARRAKEDSIRRTQEEAAAAAAMEAEVFREAERLEERREERRRRERERSARLDREAREGQERARWERARARERAEYERVAEGRAMEEEMRRRDVEEAEEEEKRRRAMEQRREAWRLQEAEKSARREKEKKREEAEAEQERRAEEAYRRLLEAEKEKMRRRRTTKPPWATDED